MRNCLEKCHGEYIGGSAILSQFGVHCDAVVCTSRMNDHGWSSRKYLSLSNVIG